MDQPFDHRGPRNDEFDLGEVRPQTSIERAMEQQIAARQRTPHPTVQPTERHVSLLGKVQTPAPLRKEEEAKEEREPKKITRRGFFRNVRDTALVAGAAAAGYKGYSTLWGESNTPMALLKMDPERKQLGLVHRLADMNVLAFDQRQGADALTLTNDGLESLLLSPELTLKPTQDEAALFRGSEDRNNTDNQVARINGTPRNIYMPYHLFADAVSFDVRKRMAPEMETLKGKKRVQPGESIVSIKGEDVKVVPYDETPLKPGERIGVRKSDGLKDRLIPLGTHELKPGEYIYDSAGQNVKITHRPRLVISISGEQKAKDLPITTDIANAAQNVKEAIGDTATGWLGNITSAWDDFKDWSGIGGDGQDTRAVERARHDAAILKREQEKPHPQVNADFEIQMDYPADGKLTNLHFYNGKTLEEPNFHILGEEIATSIGRDNRVDLRIITNDGEVRDSRVNGGVGEHQNVRYYDSRLQERAKAAMLHTDSRIEDGIITEMGTGLKKFAITDNKLNSYEEAALSIASDHITRSEDGRWTLTDRFAHRVMNRPDQDIGR